MDDQTIRMSIAIGGVLVINVLIDALISRQQESHRRDGKEWRGFLYYIGEQTGRLWAFCYRRYKRVLNRP